MHIPDGLLDPVSIVVLWGASLLVIFFGFSKIGKLFEQEDSEKLVPYIGVIAAVIFAFQFVNYPVPGGTSGHLVGGTLVAVILGPWASVIVLFMVLVVQSLFGDGGITALGANAFNMGIIGGIIGFYILYAAFWLYYMYKLGDKRAAYYAIPFEREAYAGDFAGERYLEKRHNYEWLNFL